MERYLARLQFHCDRLVPVDVDRKLLTPGKSVVFQPGVAEFDHAVPVGAGDERHAPLALVTSPTAIRAVSSRESSSRPQYLRS